MIIIKLQYIIINQKIKLMRKFLCLIWVVLAVSMAYAQKTTDVRPVSTDFPFSQISKEDQQQLEKMVPESARAAQKAAPTRKLVRADGEGEKVEYFVAAQSTTRNYSFVLNGGDIFTYNIGITRDGNKVTFSNFFNLFNPNDYTPNLDTDFSGTYDEASKTITIPLGRQSFEGWDVKTNTMRVVPGKYELMVGNSSSDTALQRLTVSIK